MKIEIEQIPEGVSFHKFECRPEEIDLSVEGFVFISPVVANLKIYRQIDKFFINFEMSVNIESECFRCLSPVRMALSALSEVQYRPLPKLPKDRLDDIGIGYYSDEYIDLSDEVRESLLLEVPMTVLCSEDCKGLCPHCGADLNLGECNCSEYSEVHLSKLAYLIKSLELKKEV